MLLTGMCRVAAASVKDVRWGVDDRQVLRLVLDLTDPATYQVNIDNNTLALTVEAPFEGAERCEPVDSKYANSFYVQAMGTQTVVRVPFLEPMTLTDVNYFTLDADAAEQKPCRIVLDVAKKISEGSVVAEQVSKPDKAADKPAEQVAVNANSGGNVSVATVGRMLSPQELIAMAARGQKPEVKSEPVRQNIDLPPMPKRETTLSDSSTTVISSQPIRVTAKNTAPKMQIGMLKSKGKNTKALTKVLESQPVAVAVEEQKVVVGNQPSNKSAAQDDAARRGREAVNTILRNIGINHSADTGSVASREQLSRPAGRPLPSLPVIADNDPVDTGRTELVPVLVRENDPLVAVDSKAGGKQARQAKAAGKYRTDGGIKGKKITIDPGHGGSDPGAVSKKNILEKNVTLAMARKLKDELEDLGAKVYLTRNQDTEVAGAGADDVDELQARVDRAEQEGSDLFISLHINSSLNRKATGISTYYFPKSNYDVKLAQAIHKQLTDNFGLKDMGVREANFYVTKKCSMPAVLMELGFLSNDKEAKLVAGNWFQNKAMTLTAKGIKDYFK